MKDMILATLKNLFAIGPILFGVAFLAPVFSELMIAADITQPFGLPPIAIGLVAGLGWGSYAYVKGSWV
ncbi:MULTISPECIES: hypothetical protein [Parvibaculaceae]|uniref:Uncharacterized protein n=1 Tax=Candidatus Phaeomarinibacter ectocarpi TaxID=1458461 RepID=X5M8N0_9HYPH|nr:hypothetical protein [Candidatus Phaeomarinobacter ectocarpi]CDO59688.1 hypothetical protein BN1012_Phect1474 [Candidatus Phaeomarinobacter ectocarpi]